MYGTKPTKARLYYDLGTPPRQMQAPQESQKGRRIQGTAHVPNRGYFTMRRSSIPV